MPTETLRSAVLSRRPDPDQGSSRPKSTRTHPSAGSFSSLRHGFAGGRSSTERIDVEPSLQMSRKRPFWSKRLGALVCLGAAQLTQLPFFALIRNAELT